MSMFLISLNQVGMICEVLSYIKCDQGIDNREGAKNSGAKNAGLVPSR